MPKQAARQRGRIDHGTTPTTRVAVYGARMREMVSRAAATVASHLGVALLFVGVTIFLRGVSISSWTALNPDEAELMAQGRAAMHSPVPFTTWTMGTTGPYWPFFLALLGAIGFPLTLAFAHVLAASLVGVMGYLVFVLLRRTMGPSVGLFSAILWWLPIALIFPVGGTPDFGALSTELLPCVLVLAAALVPTDRLKARPWLFLIPGMLSGIAVAAKYQVAPVALSLMAIQLLALRVPLRRAVRPALFWVAGAAAPIILVVLAVALSPRASTELVRETFTFLGSYAGGVDLMTRVKIMAHLLLRQGYLFVAAVLLVRLAFISEKRVLMARGLMVFGGLVAVFAGGMGFGHYLYLLFTAIAIAVALPLAPGAQIVPWRLVRSAAVLAAAVAVLAVMAIEVGAGRFAVSQPSAVAATFSRGSVERVASLERVCPEGSDVLVWGWASELYVAYSWNNTVPFMNTLGLTSSPSNIEAARGIVAQGISASDCVIDAVGDPFFAVKPEQALTRVYPDMAATLERDFHVAQGAIDCDACTVYVRNDP